MPCRDMAPTPARLDHGGHSRGISDSCPRPRRIHRPGSGRWPAVSGMHVVAVQEILGHEWLNPAMIYVHVEKSHAEDAWIPIRTRLSTTPPRSRIRNPARQPRKSAPAVATEGGLPAARRVVWGSVRRRREGDLADAAELGADSVPGPAGAVFGDADQSRAGRHSSTGARMRCSRRRKTDHSSSTVVRSVQPLLRLDLGAVDSRSSVLRVLNHRFRAGCSISGHPARRWAASAFSRALAPVPRSASRSRWDRIRSASASIREAAV